MVVFDNSQATDAERQRYLREHRAQILKRFDGHDEAYILSYFDGGHAPHERLLVAVDAGGALREACDFLEKQ